MKNLALWLAGILVVVPGWSLLIIVPIWKKISKWRKGGVTVRTRWLVEPKDSHTNEVLSRLRPGEEIQTVKVILPGNITKEVKVWQISFADLTVLERSKTSGLNYRAYAQEGNGRIRPHLYLLKKRLGQKHRTIFKAAAQALKKIAE
ncbi:MAG: hypothetical protein Q8N61_00280 [bacterium]|nr:hypothetical protein [bacterium]